jgi:2-keto-4-pentenoate hydratase/2-oxohepta-3-ene-1,7-dioic acid hydratase in catechol pathway
MDKLICIGKNYLEHAKELGDAIPEKPVLFIKPPSVLITALQPGQNVRAPLPTDHGSIHHECEIVVKISKGGHRMSLEQARASIESVTLGLDMTLRDLQGKLKKAGAPWEISKVFPGSAITGPWLKVSEFSNWLEEEFTFAIDGAVRQKGRGSQMRMPPAECIAYASEYFPLSPGDLVFTGTPAGVGPVQAGQSAVLSWGPRLSYGVNWA